MIYCLLTYMYTTLGTAGVGDLYTDPQMHTVDQKEYGEANLGTRGMALFFSSHVCGPLCETIGGLELACSV